MGYLPVCLLDRVSPVKKRGLVPGRGDRGWAESTPSRVDDTLLGGCLWTACPLHNAWWRLDGSNLHRLAAPALRGSVVRDRGAGGLWGNWRVYKAFGKPLNLCTELMAELANGGWVSRPYLPWGWGGHSLLLCCPRTSPTPALLPKACVCFLQIVPFLNIPRMSQFDCQSYLLLGKIEGRRRMGQKRMRWLAGITDSMDMSLNMRWWRTGKPCVLQSMGSQRVGHDWATEQQSGRTNIKSEF